ncbi:MAG TPA: hypothetical protein V6D34_12440 [Candidatus Sericytochromatia bacterium]
MNKRFFYTAIAVRRMTIIVSLLQGRSCETSVRAMQYDPRAQTTLKGKIVAI